MSVDEPKRRVRVCNTSKADEVRGTVCNGCDWFEVLTRKKWFNDHMGVGFRDVEHYYCSKMGASVDPKAMTRERCDSIMELRRYQR